MASLAVLLKQKGHKVWGTDQNIYPPMNHLLAQNHITVYEGYNSNHLKKQFDVAVIGNALSRGNPEIEEILNKRLSYASLPEIIRKEFLQKQKSVVITGTHGKTTVTGMLSWVLDYAGLSPSFLVGGIMNNFNYSAKLGRGDYFVIEGDEYDSAYFDKRPKFLHYFPHILVINNIEFDHSDIYSDINQIKDGFKKLIRLIPENGLIIANGDDPNVRDVVSEIYSSIQYFGKSKKNDWYFIPASMGTVNSEFIVYRNSKKFYRYKIPLEGEYQMYNALAMIAVATHIGLNPQQIQGGLQTFKNVKRRLEFWGQLNGAIFYNDFAHHPTAIRATLNAIKDKHSDKKVLAIFEPRTNTTIKNIFQKELGEALSLADYIVILPLHRAEKIPEKNRLSLEKMNSDLERKGKKVSILKSYDEIIPRILKILDSSQVAILMTNGNLGGQYEKLKNLFTGQI